MVDVVDKQTRSRMMSGIKGKNTNPELIVRKGIHARGFRYRLHVSRLAGKPDLVLPRYNAVIFVHGCFWHGHDCHLFKWPSTRPEWWESKINGNMARDEEAYAALHKQGWRILTLWECALKGKSKRPSDAVLEEITIWLRNNNKDNEIRGINGNN